MKFSYYIIAVTYFMAALGLSAISLVEEISAPFLIVMSSAATFSLILNLGKKELIRGAAWNVLAAAIFIFFISDYLFISESLIASASRFLTILLALKLYDLKKNRDYLIVFLLVFFQILASAASTVSPVFFLILSLFVIGIIWAMIIFNIKKDLQDSAHGSELPKMVFGLPFFFSIIAISAVSLVMTFMLFFILPRMGIGFFERKTANTLKVSGFSDRVDLGTIGPVKQDSTIIMRVELKGKAPTDILYFRGTVLDTYDGFSWNKKVKDNTLIRRGYDGVFRLTKHNGRLLEQNILLEPLDTEVFFAASMPVFVDGMFSSIWTDGTGSMHLPSPPYSRIEYKAWSAVNAPIPDKFVKAQYADASYLNSSKEGKKIIELASDITKGLSTDEEKAVSIEKYLRSNYKYTLNPAQGKGESPLEDFLFYSKEGYCEHYATAMTIMLRALNIPSRLVTGFVQGEWNSYGNYFIIRQQDAHSWVEAYIDGKGWVRFDPTPPSGIASLNKPMAVTLYLDMLRWKWNRYVIHYSFTDQQKLAKTVEGRSKNIFEKLRSSFNIQKPKGAQYLLSVLAVIIAIALTTAVFWKLIGLKSKKAKTPPFYIETLKVLKRKGISRAPQETPLEFALRTGNSNVRLITEAFHKERYGDVELAHEELEGVKTALKELKKRK